MPLRGIIVCCFLLVSLSSTVVALDALHGVSALCDAELYNAAGSWEKSKQLTFNMKPELMSFDDVLAVAHYNITGYKYASDSRNIRHLGCATNDANERLTYHFAHDWIVEQTSASKCVFPTYATFPQYLSYYEGKTIVFLGDSITELNFHSTRHLINAIVPCACEMVDHSDASMDICVCSDITLVYKRMNRFVVALHNKEKKSLETTIIDEVSTWLEEWQTNSRLDLADAIFIVNQGAHTGGLLDRANEFSAANLFIGELLIKFGRATVVVRSTLNGHINCTAENVVEIDKYKANNAGHDLHAWNSFADTNAQWELAVSMMARTTHRVFFMDSNQLLYDRSDGHSTPPGDCLHYCSPGPIDHVAFQFSLFLQSL